VPPRIRDADDTIDGADVLPGFSYPTGNCASAVADLLFATEARRNTEGHGEEQPQ
jgi:hypothetical protein